MGSSASTQLKCPKGFDEEKFNIVLQLYDKLDKDGDHVVESHEIREISKLHIDNKIRDIQQDIIKDTQTLQRNLDKIEFNKSQMIKQLKEDAILDTQSIKNKNEIRTKLLNDKIKTYSNLSDEDRSKQFMTAITNSNEDIEFWKFFEYMKTRTDDIKNIKF